MSEGDAATLRELLQEAQLALHRAETRERRLRSESAAALEAVRVLVEASNEDELLDLTLDMLRPLLDYAEAFVLLRAGDAAAVAASTRPGWPCGEGWHWTGPLARAAAGRPVAFFDAAHAPLWRDRGAADREGVVSVLCVPLRLGQGEGMLVCVHPQRGHFGPASIDLAQRLSPLIGQVLRAVGGWARRLARQERAVTDVSHTLAVVDLRNQALLEAMDDGVMVEDAEGRVALANPAFGRLFGLAEVGALVGLPSGPVSVEASRLFVDPAGFLATVRAAEGGRGAVQDTLSTRDGRVLERTSRPILDGGQIRGRLWVYRDITERVRAAEQLREAKETAERANLAKNDFLASISHEIRTPLNAIMGMTELVMDSALTPTQADLVGSVRAASAQLHHLLSDLLDFSRIESDTLELARERFDIGALCEDIAAGFAATAVRRGRTLDVAVEPGARCTLGDAARVRQIVANLVSNALQHAEDGNVLVTVEAVERDLFVRVRDAGPGVSAAARERIFSRFERGDRAGPGTGLGLSISRNLAERMGGFLTLEPDDPERPGACFLLHLPGARLLSGPPHQRPLLERLVGIDLPMRQLGPVRTQLENLGAKVRVLGADARLAGMAAVLVDRRVLGARLGAFRDAGLRVVVCLAHAEPVPTGVDAHVRRPVTREALRRALLDQSERVAAPAVGRGRVLLAEDDPNNRVVAEHYLRNAGCEVVVAGTGAEAVARAEEGGIDLVLMDVQMPDMDGIQATRLLRAGPMAHLPVLALTAHATAAVRRRCEEAGMNGFLTKPIARAGLLHALDAWRGPRPRVLVVDDDASARQLLELRLRKADQPHVVMADSAAEALRRFVLWWPQLVLLDLEMPDMMGDEVAARMRALERPGRPAATIVIVSAHTEAPVAARLAGLGIAHIIEKPVRQDALDAVLLDHSPAPVPALRPPEAPVQLDPALMALVPAYLEDVWEAIRSMQAAIAADDRPALLGLAHRFKGTGGAYGFPQITEVCRHIEDHAREGELARCERLVVGLAAWLAQVEVEARPD